MMLTIYILSAIALVGFLALRWSDTRHPVRGGPVAGEARVEDSTPGLEGLGGGRPSPAAPDPQVDPFDLTGATEARVDGSAVWSGTTEYGEGWLELGPLRRYRRAAPHVKDYEQAIVVGPEGGRFSAALPPSDDAPSVQVFTASGAPHPYLSAMTLGSPTAGHVTDEMKVNAKADVYQVLLTAHNWPGGTEHVIIAFRSEGVDVRARVAVLSPISSAAIANVESDAFLFETGLARMPGISSVELLLVCRGEQYVPVEARTEVMVTSTIDSSGKRVEREGTPMGLDEIDFGHGVDLENSRLYVHAKFDAVDFSRDAARVRLRIRDGDGVVHERWEDVPQP